MPLTDIQRAIAQLLAKNRSPDSYLAGGAALLITPESKRYSNDLDYFHDSEERVASAFANDRETLLEAGYDVKTLLSQPGFVRAVVHKETQDTKVEWAHDTAWRFMPTIETEGAGFQLHPVDLAINKLLALVGRDEPRDFLDIIEMHRHTLPLGALCWATAGKDPGYTPPLLLSMLRRRGKYRPEDFGRLMLTETPNLPELKQEWLAALDEADHFVAARDPEQMGCLYYSLATQRFVGDLDTHADAVPHYGRPGGVLPTIRLDQ